MLHARLRNTLHPLALQNSRASAKLLQHLRDCDECDYTTDVESHGLGVGREVRVLLGGHGGGGGGVELGEVAGDEGEDVWGVG